MKKMLLYMPLLLGLLVASCDSLVTGQGDVFRSLVEEFEKSQDRMILNLALQNDAIDLLVGETQTESITLTYEQTSLAIDFVSVEVRREPQGDVRETVAPITTDRIRNQEEAGAKIPFAIVHKNTDGVQLPLDGADIILQLDINDQSTAVNANITKYSAVGVLEFDVLCLAEGQQSLVFHLYGLAGVYAEGETGRGFLDKTEDVVTKAANGDNAFELELHSKFLTKHALEVNCRLSEDQKNDADDDPSNDDDDDDDGDGAGDTGNNSFSGFFIGMNDSIAPSGYFLNRKDGDWDFTDMVVPGLEGQAQSILKMIRTNSYFAIGGQYTGTAPPTAYYSSDETSFTAVSPVTTPGITLSRDLAYGNNRIVMTSNPGQTHGGIFVTTDNGQNWSQSIINTPTTDNRRGSLVFADPMGVSSRFVYVDGKWSTDGLTWESPLTTAPSHPVASQSAIGYGNNRIWIYRTPWPAYSDDGGVSWQNPPSPAPNGCSTAAEIAYGAGTWVVVCGAGGIHYSTNEGVGWSAADTTQVTTSSPSYSGVAHHSELGFVAVAPTHGGQGAMVESSNGITWTEITLPSGFHPFASIDALE